MFAFARTNPRFALTLTLFAIGLAAILAAWGFELIGGYIPCELCLLQRTPYYIGLPIALVALISDWFRFPKWVTWLALVLVAIAFFYNGGLGVYQSGAQWGFWQGPTSCSGNGSSIPASVDNLLSSLDHARVVSCTEVTWRFAGLSFAGWNAVISAIVGLLALSAIVIRPSKR